MFSKNDLPDITEREAAFALHRTWEDLADKAHELAHVDADPEAIRLADAKAKEAEEAYDASGIKLETDEAISAIRCAVCGAPIREGDETLFDFDTGEHVLRAAIGLPPRADQQTLPDMEEVA